MMMIIKCKLSIFAYIFMLWKIKKANPTFSFIFGPINKITQFLQQIIVKNVHLATGSSGVRTQDFLKMSLFP